MLQCITTQDNKGTSSTHQSTFLGASFDRLYKEVLKSIFLKIIITIVYYDRFSCQLTNWQFSWHFFNVMTISVGI